MNPKGKTYLVWRVRGGSRSGSLRVEASTPKKAALVWAQVVDTNSPINSTVQGQVEEVRVAEDREGSRFSTYIVKPKLTYEAFRLG